MCGIAQTLESRSILKEPHPGDGSGAARSIWRFTNEVQTFDIVVADPPAFIKERRALASGLKGYAKLARLCAEMVGPEGMLFMASCSHHAAPAAFRKAVEEGMRAAGRSFTLLRQAGADRDHPVHPQLPENAYLKALTYGFE